MVSKYEIFPLFLLVHKVNAGFTLPLKSANLGLLDSWQVSQDYWILKVEDFDAKNLRFMIVYKQKKFLEIVKILPYWAVFCVT
jgi:hypothetical protein